MNLVNRLQELTGYALTLGHRKLTYFFKFQFDFIVNHKKLYRHLAALDLLQPKHVKKPKKKKPPTAIYYCPLQSNIRWEADLTLVPYQSGFLYLFSVIDVFDKELIGHHFGFRCRKDDAIEALKAAVYSRFPSGKIPDHCRVTLRLDRGCQFTAFDFAKAAKILNVEIEFCDVHAPNQKPFIESFFSNFKREEVYRNDYQNPAQAFSAWADYCHWYNNLRPHAALNYLSPLQFRRSKMPKHSQVAGLFLSNLIGA